jgi:hypothetical protein
VLRVQLEAAKTVDHLAARHGAARIITPRFGRRDESPKKSVQRSREGRLLTRAYADRQAISVDRDEKPAYGDARSADCGGRYPIGELRESHGRAERFFAYWMRRPLEK